MRLALVLLLVTDAQAALRVGLPRVMTPRMCSTEPAGTPIVNRETLARIQSELYRAEDSDREVLVREQSDLIRSLLGEISAALTEAPDSPGGGSGAHADLAEEVGMIPDMMPTADVDASLNAVVAPHLPVLLGASFPMAARDVLGTLRSEDERTALLSLSRFVMGVQAEVGVALQELQWRQQQKLRELCDASTDGGTERLAELAQAMRDELDTDFCNYLNYAIEQEEERIRTEGATPFEPPLPPYAGGGVSSLPPGMREELEEEERQARMDAAQMGQQLEPMPERRSLPGSGGDGGGGGGGAGTVSPRQSDAWSRLVEGVEMPWGGAPATNGGEGGSGNELPEATAGQAPGDAAAAADEEEMQLAPVPEAPPPVAASQAAVPSGLAAVQSGGQLAGNGAIRSPVEGQQWLLVLRLVRQGVYSMLAKDYQVRSTAP
jgi:hypothetical protein